MIIEFENIDMMFMDCIMRLIRAPQVESRIGGSRELLGYSARLTNLSGAWLFNPTRRISPHYAAGELLWYLSGSDELDIIKYYAPSYVNYSDDGITARGAYGKRMAEVNAFRLIPEILRKSSTSRQAIISIWRSDELMIVNTAKTKDVPCTLTIQFLIRDGKLNCINNMRSNDAWLGMPYDIFCFTSLQRLIADFMGIETGWYQHNVGSMHLYDKHFEKGQIAVSTGYDIDDLDMSYPEGILFPENIEQAVKYEKNVRETKTLSEDLGKIGNYGLLSNVVRMAACHTDTRFIERITCKALRNYCERFYDANN